MRTCLLAFLAAVTALQGVSQATQTQYTTDLNGHRVPQASFSSDGPGQRTELHQSVNGRKVPLEKTESKLLSDGPSGKVIETIVRRYDASGQLMATQRTVSEELKRADGSSTLKATVSYSDTNGTLREGERRVVETKKQGATTTAEVSVSRAGIDGGFQELEKRKVVSTQTADGIREEESVFRRAATGQFQETARTSKTEQKKAGQTIVAADHYELDFAGRMQLAGKEVKTAIKNPDGSETIQTEIRGGVTPGSVASENGGLALKEQQIVVRKANPDGTVTETTSSRRPSLADGNRLGEAQVISQVVCSGNCISAAAPAADPKATASDKPKP